MLRDLFAELELYRSSKIDMPPNLAVYPTSQQLSFDTSN